MEKDVDKIMAFDTLFTNNQIQMYKILLSYLPPALQYKFAIYIKFLELQYTIDFFRIHPQAALKCFSHETSIDRGKIFDEMIPFCDSSQIEQLNQIKRILQSLDSMQEMMEMMEMLKAFFPEGPNPGNATGTDGSDGFDISQIISMLGGNDFSGMFDMFNSFSNNNENTTTDI